jgi:hypothetical protein
VKQELQVLTDRLDLPDLLDPRERMEITVPGAHRDLKEIKVNKQIKFR